MRKKQTLFRKVYLVVLFSALLSALCLALVFLLQYRHQSGRSLVPALTVFYRRNAVDLGDPPTLDNGLKVSSRLGVDLVFLGSGNSWSTSADPELSSLAETLRREGDNARGFYRRKLYVGFRDSRGYFLFYGNLLFNVERLTSLGTGLILMGFLSYGLTLLLLRQLLSPVKNLQKGVEALRRGDLTVLIPRAGNDELGDLADGFNLMTGRIRNMMESKEQMLLDAGHELKTPITRMKLTLEFMEEDSLRDSLREDLDEMEKKVQELLASARLETPYGRPRKTVLLLKPLLEELADRPARQSPGIILRLPEKEPTITADPDLLRTACRNLLENSLRYSPESAHPVEISCRRRESGTEILFRDWGPGIPEEFRDRVFEPFYRLDSSRNRKTGGSGLGLYLVKKIVAAHNGTLRLETPEGGGLLAGLWLPD